MRWSASFAPSRCRNARSPWLLLCWWLAFWVAACSRTNEQGPGATPLRVAVAANFRSPASELIKAFEQQSRARVEMSTGSSGKLYAQIENGAPFEVFLSADSERPHELAQKGLAVQGSQTQYALGRLALYGPHLQSPDDVRDALKRSAFRHLSIANPETAPYGAAAKQALETMGLWDVLSSRVVRGENIAQTYQFVESGGAELGFVALSSVVAKPRHSYWVVPPQLHQPIRQDAVLLARGADHPHARAFLEFLVSPTARRIIEAAGYGTE